MDQESRRRTWNLLWIGEFLWISFSPKINRWKPLCCCWFWLFFFSTQSSPIQSCFDPSYSQLEVLFVIVMNSSLWLTNSRLNCEETSSMMMIMQRITENWSELLQFVMNFDSGNSRVSNCSSCSCWFSGFDLWFWTENV